MNEFELLTDEEVLVAWNSIRARMRTMLQLKNRKRDVTAEWQEAETSHRKIASELERRGLNTEHPPLL